MLTGVAILERELGIIVHSQHRLQRRLEARLSRAEAARLRAELGELEERRQRTLLLLDEANEEYDERLQRSTEGIRARAMSSPRTRKESPEQARRRLGLP